MAQQQDLTYPTLADTLWSPTAGSNAARAIALAVAGSILLAISAISAIIIVGLGLWRTARGPRAQTASSSSAVSDSTSATVRSSESEIR